LLTLEVIGLLLKKVIIVVVEVHYALLLRPRCILCIRLFGLRAWVSVVSVWLVGHVSTCARVIGGGGRFVAV